MPCKQVFSRRLKSAREMKGLSMKDLSAELGNIVTPQAIYKYESGKMFPGSPLLIDLAKVLGVSPDYFFRPFVMNISGIEFRKKSKLGKKERMSIESIAMDRLERYVEIEDICGNLSERKIRKESFKVELDDDVIAVARKLRNDSGCESDRIPNVIEFLESLGAIVIEIEASDSFDGLSGFAGDIPVIVINRNFPPERKRFTALHELGHLVLSFPKTIDNKRVEAMCSSFASEMLLPFDKFKSATGEIFRGRIFLQDLAQLQREYGISIDALIYKAQRGGLISENKHKQYHITKRTRPAFKKYAETSRTNDEFSDRFERMVYCAFDKDLISASKAASLLGISGNEVLEHSMMV